VDHPRILVIYPYPSIDTNPFMAFLLESLAARRVAVDVLLEHSPQFVAPDPFGASVHLKVMPSALADHQPVSDRNLLRRVAMKLILPSRHPDYSLRFDPTIFGLRETKRYSVVVGVDPHGITVADRFNRWARRPLVYVSFEIQFAGEATSPYEAHLLGIEREACRRAAVALVQDEERAEVFCRETSFPRERVLVVPVAPPPDHAPRTDYLRRALAIPSDRRIVLYCGALEPWASRDELTELVSHWPERYCLVVHTSSRVDKRKARYLERLTETGRIFVSAQPVGRRDLRTLVASADFGLAPYKPVPDHWWTGDNLYHLGFSSGKVAYYAMCGLPILARPLPVFERVFARYDCGRLYSRLADTGGYLEEMDRTYARHAEEARRFYREQLDPVPGMARFCDTLMRLAADASGRHHRS
jgi:hypothetical protein